MTTDLVLRDLGGFHAAESLIYQARRSDGRLRVDLSGARRIYPNGAVPFAAAVQFFKARDMRLEFPEASEEIRAAHVLAPKQACDWNEHGRVTNVVWEYGTPQEASQLTNAFTAAIQDNVECGRGVIDALTWCLYEVMDNVFQHSRAESGFVMMQLHRKSRLCAITVADTGIGVHKSFAESGTYSASNAYEALKNAVQERVTSKPKNMGNGLYGLIRVVGLNGGRLEIRSGHGRLVYEDRKLTGDAMPGRPLLDPTSNHGTSVDWQLNMGRSVTLGQALSTPRPIPSRLEPFEDEWGRVVLSVREFEREIGSRTGASEVHTRLVNAIEDSDSPVILDFDGIGVVSSSFADEVIGKLVLARGRKYFDRHVILANANLTVLGIIERAIVQRVQEGDENYPAREIP